MIEFIPFSISNKTEVISMMEDFYKIDNYPFDTEKANLLMGEFISNPHLGNGWVINYHKKTAGYLILTFIFSFEYGGRIAFLDELFIKSHFRGSGIAQETMRFIDTQKEKLNINLYYLEVEPHNIIAQNIYKKHQFIIHDRLIMQK